MLAWFAGFGPAGAPGLRLMGVADALAARRRGRAAAPPPPRLLPPPHPRARAATAPAAMAANAYFVALRLVEDDHYQATLRQTLSAYANSVDGEGSDGLALDLPFSERFALKPLASRLDEISSIFGGLNLSLTSAFFPWNRTFEIGLIASASAAQ